MQFHPNVLIQSLLIEEGLFDTKEGGTNEKQKPGTLV